MRLAHEPNLRTRGIVYAAAVLSFSLIAQGEEKAADWVRFRGPNGQGTAEADRIPLHFGPDTNVLWKTAVPPGKSSPVIWDGRIFLTAYDPTNKRTLVTLAVDREHGRILWRQAVGRINLPRHRQGHRCSDAGESLHPVDLEALPPEQVCPGRAEGVGVDESRVGLVVLQSWRNDEAQAATATFGLGTTRATCCGTICRPGNAVSDETERNPLHAIPLPAAEMVGPRSCLRRA